MQRFEYYTLLGWEAEVKFTASKRGRKDFESEYEISSFSCGSKNVRPSTDRTLFNELMEHFEEHHDFLDWAETIEQGMVEELEQGSESDD